MEVSCQLREGSLQCQSNGCQFLIWILGTGFTMSKIPAKLSVFKHRKYHKKKLPAKCVYLWKSILILYIVVRGGINLFLNIKKRVYLAYVDSKKYISFIDIDECSEGTNDCHVDSTCTDTEGSYICTCKNGFSGNGVQCDRKCLNIQLGL